MKQRLVFACLVSCAFLIALSQTAIASNLCVNPGGTHGCYSSIQVAVNHAVERDVIRVASGTYKEEVTIATSSLALLGEDAATTSIDAATFPNGIFIDGFDHAGLHNVSVSGFTVKNALFEGILAVSASEVSIRDNQILDNDTSPGLNFTGVATGCPGQPAFETDETGDCGGAVHLIGTSRSVLSGNLVKGNADGLLISDETGESSGNIVANNVFDNNPLECGIVLASHPPVGSTPPYFAPHYGVNHNTVVGNVSSANGVAIGGAGVGLFSDGNGPGTVSGNLILRNKLVGNGLGGVSLHTHVGPSFGAPADDMDGNAIIGNVISSNLADTFDTATPGRVGININSGGGGSPVRGTIISGNTISDEDIDIAVNTPAEVQIHFNNLLGGNIGVGDICNFDGAAACNSTLDATFNFWGCSGGPGTKGCSTIYPANAADVLFRPFLEHRIGGN